MASVGCAGTIMFYRRLTYTLFQNSSTLTFSRWCNPADDQVAVAYASVFRRHLTQLGRRYEVADVPATSWFLILSCSSFLPA
ncbi:hypothetical protein T12_1000, partial [Trichinella patagoniensis]